MSSTRETLASLDEIDVEIEKIVAGGDGLARYKGIPVFVHLAAPGDRLRVRVYERKPSYCRADIIEVLSPGPDRREPPCPHFSRCGGCSLQHMTDEAQTSWRVRAAQEALLRIGRLQDTTGEVIAGSPWHYRIRTQLQLEASSEGVRLGYLRRRSHEMVPIEACPVLTEPLEAFVLKLAKKLGEAPPRRLDVAAGDGGALSCGPVVPGLPKGMVERKVGAYTYGFDSRTFFQAHAQLLGELIETVVGGASGETALDLYAGVGLFTLPLAERYSKVVAVESDRVAVRYLKKNAQRHRLSNVTVEGESVESWISRMPADVDRVILDPPRAGLGLKVRHTLKKLRPRKITYASCHPAALARDLASLSEVFSVEKLTYLDLFPQTGHIEVVVDLSLDAEGS